jgi:carboxylate-amine ligase
VEHAFGQGAPFSVGIEEELLLVDPGDHRLAHESEQVLKAIRAEGGWQADHEAYASQLELRSAPAGGPADAVRALAAARAAARAAAATLMGVGLHPAAEAGDVRLVQAERYRTVESSMRGLIRRTPECALHVHVGMPDPESAVRAFNGLREWLPLLQALAAGSPWWFGADSGMASARAALIRAYPGRGIPRALRDFDDYANALAAVTTGGGPDDYTLVWWDVRPHPRLGTVEVRELDVQARLDDVVVLAALVQALARLEAESPPRRWAPSEALEWSAFRAARDGLEAQVLHEGRLVPVPDAARAAVTAARPHAPEPEALDEVERLLADGGGAARQRSAHRQGGMARLLRQLVEETSA